MAGALLSNAAQLTTPALLRPLLILLENPLLEDSDNLNSVTAKLCLAITSLPIESRRYLELWWATARPPRLQHSFNPPLTPLLPTPGLFNQESSAEWTGPGAGSIGAGSAHAHSGRMQLLDDDEEEEEEVDPKTVTRTDPSSLAHDMKLQKMRTLSSEDSGLEGGPSGDMNGDFESLRKLVVAIQQLISIHLIGTGSKPEDDSLVQAATRFLHMINRGTRIGGVLPYSIFYNEVICDSLDMRTTFLRWLRRDGFTFCDHPCVLDAHTKSRIIQLESNVSQQRELEEAFFRSLLTSGGLQASALYLVITIRRDHLIQDSLAQLTRHTHDLKKQLKIKFVGEEGVDAGGVQKEWFQLIVKEIFDAKYGMFTYDEETRVYWFNPHSFDAGSEFELIGMLLGLAVYNGVITNVQLPMVIYRKLLGVRVSLNDLADLNPGLARGLQQLLQFDGDVESTYERTFQVTEEGLFGDQHQVELKPGGAEIPLTNANRREYVRLYVDHILRRSVSRQFEAFKRGFSRVIAGPALQLFVPEELELLVCGSPILDFHDLERATKYDNGFRADHPLIKSFWRIVHSLDQEDQKRLLFFCTGSDRAPVKGLGDMVFVIARNGPDSDRLPTAHTCFNILLLPEYANEAKMKTLLTTALRNAEGFGLQ